MLSLGAACKLLGQAVVVLWIEPSFWDFFYATRTEENLGFRVTAGIAILITITTDIELEGIVVFVLQLYFFQIPPDFRIGVEVLSCCGLVVR